MFNLVSDKPSINVGNPNFFLPIKGQKISKANYLGFLSSKNWTKYMLNYALASIRQTGKYFVHFLVDKRSSWSAFEIFWPLATKGNISLKLWLMKLLWLSKTLYAPHYLYVELSALNVVGRDFTEFTEMLIYCQQMDQNTHKS